jgi:uncharacterized protein YndB with AHSA1/START domain
MEMDFVVDKEAKTVSITKEFAFGLDLVWDAYTKPELLDQWWAPKPWMSRTKVLDFKVGGRRFYAMVSPEGDERWAVQKYTSITPKTNFKLFNAFADKMKISNCRAPIGTSISVNRTERQRSAFLFTTSHWNA